ncbi:MAG: M20/M25/M40 family metallo-hydrolase, partial [Sulfolobus sp.]|nr:M20/M25/M40 family metallo-hydrolase [Sulfolobus sp.]
INTIPGVDVIYMDCRILPEYSLDEVLDFIRAEAYNFSLQSGCKINIEIVQRDMAPRPTDPNNEFVKTFSKAIKEVRGIEAKPIGIGGGTVAKYFREKGIPSIVWMTTEGTAHEPNERVKLINIINDAKVVFYYLTSQKV